MNAKLKDALQRVETWPEWAQDELASTALEIDAELRAGTYEPTREELRKLDEASHAVRRGEVATAEEVEALFAKHRRP